MKLLIEKSFDAEKIKQTDGFPWKGIVIMSVRLCTLMNTWNHIFFNVFEDVTQAYGVKVSVFLGYVCVT